MTTLPPLIGEFVLVGRLTAGDFGSVGYIGTGWSWAQSAGTGSGIWPVVNPPQPTPRASALDTVRANLATQERLSESDLALMREYGIKLNEVLRPGIYQMEFDVAGLGEHREWVRVNASGNSDLITAAPNNGVLDVRVTTFENDAHGALKASGAIRAYAVGGTIGNTALTNDLWSRMVAEANEHDARGLNYHYNAQNSNSVFSTVGSAAGLMGREDGGNAALGQSRDLNDVIPSGQPPSIPGPSSNSISGTAGGDVLAGGSTTTAIFGNDGNDTLTGGSVGDEIEGGNGADNITVLGGSALGGAGNDNLAAATASPSVTLYGNLDNDTLNGSAGTDRLDGGPGNDFLHGRGDDDQLDAQAGADTVYGGQGIDVLIGGDGNDFVSGDLGNDNVLGGGGDDAIYGQAGHDALSGGGGRDVIDGGDGDDFIRGGAMADNLRGGAGADTFAIDYKGGDWFGVTDSYWTRSGSPPGGYVQEVDTIYDFQSGVDKINLESFAKYGANAATLVFQQEAGGIRVGWFVAGGGAYGFDGEVFLSGATPVTTSDFIF